MRIDNGREEAKTTGKLTGETVENIPRIRIAGPCQRGDIKAGLLRFTALQVESLESGPESVSSKVFSPHKAL